MRWRAGSTGQRELINSTSEDTSPLYQPNRPSHIKALGGELFTSLSPEELEAKRAALRAELAELDAMERELA